MGFQFRFEQLLHYRRHILDRAENEYGKALEKVQIIRQEYDYIENQKQSFEKILHDMRCKGLTAEEHEIFVENLDGLEWKAKLARRRLEEAVMELEAQREKLIEAKKRLETLETLKERELEEYRRGFLKKEQKLADEIATVRVAGKDYES